MQKQIFNIQFYDKAIRIKKLGKILILFCFFTIDVQGQEWNVYSMDDKLKIEFRFDECHDKINDVHQQRVFFRYSNLTDNSLEVHLIMSSVYMKNGKETSIKNDKPEFILSLSPGQILEGNCNETDNFLNLFSKMLNFKSSELKDFTIKIAEIK